MNYWIACSFKSNAYTIVIDSLKKIESRSELKLNAKDYEINKLNALINIKDSLIVKQDQNTEKLRAELKRESKWKVIWRKSTSGIGAAFILYLGYNHIKKNKNMSR